MKKDLEICINKIYPHNWDEYSQRMIEEKEQEFDTVSFFLKNHAIDSRFLRGGELCVEFYEKPDFLVYLKDMPQCKIGLEVTKCYADEKCNVPKINSDLIKICKEVVNEINKVDNAKITCKINYINVTFIHSIMAGERFDKNKLKSELRAYILNGNNQECNYIQEVKAEYCTYYPADNVKVELNSNMMYLVSRISDIQKDADAKYKDPVIRCIEKKEKKLKNYKEKNSNTVSEWWLCIEVPEDAHLNPRSYQLPEKFNSKYNKIALVTKAFFGFGTYLILNQNC